MKVSKNNVLVKIGACLCFIVFIWGVLLVVDAIQHELRSGNLTQSVEIKGNSGNVKKYNVDGLTEEQVDQLIEIEQNRRDD